MLRPPWIAITASITLTMLFVRAVPAQTYPAKPIRIVTSVAGGINDLVARVLAQGISGPLGQPVIVDHRGVVAFDLVAHAQPDGYTLLPQGSPFWIGPLLQKPA